MANVRCTTTTKPSHLLAKAARQMSSSSSTHSEACARRSTSLFFFPKVWWLNGISHINNVLYTLPHGNEASQSHNDFEAPTQRETNLQVSRMGQHCTLGIINLFQNSNFDFSVQYTNHNWGGRSNREDRTRLFSQRESNTTAALQRIVSDRT